MTSSTQPNAPIADWRLEEKTEPALRVGIILPADERKAIQLSIPDAPHELHGGGPALSCRDTTVLAQATGSGVTLTVGAEPPHHAAQWRIAPKGINAPQRGRGILVREIVAGRGFHWRKLIDQTLGGSLEIVRSGDHLILVNEIALEDYLAGVITAEMSGACPPALLEAQAVVARSWLLAMSEPKHNDDPFDRCNDDCCQRYQGTDDLSDAAIDAVLSTRGTVLLDEAGHVVDANYSKSCGGISELPTHVWGIDKPGLSEVVDAPDGDPAHAFLPVTEANLQAYLTGEWLNDTSIYCSPNAVPEDTFSKYLGRVDERGSYFRWTVEYERSDLENLLRRRLPDAANLVTLNDIRVLSRGVSGRAREAEFVWTDDRGSKRTTRIVSEYGIRAVLHEGFLYSSAVAIEIKRDEDLLPETITLRGAGWGHGAGLCQIGALGMALKSKTASEICNHYFPGATLGKAYE